MDASSELVHSLLPVFMVSVLGATVMTVGVIEGVAEATASISKLLSGALSDSLRRRKPLVVAGYGLAAVTKPLFPLASSVTWVFVARFVDRVGKGIRGAPRDALVADITPPRLRGAAFGLRQALDSVGAFAGPLLALLLMWWFGNDIRAVLWAAVVPAFVAVAVLVIFVREPPRADSTPQSLRFSAALVSQLPVAYWTVVLLGGVFTLARFSEAFLLLRAQDVGLGVGYVPGVLIVMNVVYAGIAYPAGVAADRIGRYPLLIAGLAVLVAADLVLAFATVPRGRFLRRRLVGSAHGADAGSLLEAGRGHGAVEPPRSGFWHVPSRDGVGPVPGERAGRGAVDHHRPIRHVHRRLDIRWSCDRRPRGAEGKPPISLGRLTGERSRVVPATYAGCRIGHSWREASMTRHSRSIRAYDRTLATLSRRELLNIAWKLGAAAVAAPTVSSRVYAQMLFETYPFTLGVASGDPWPDSVLLWTRIAPRPLEGGGMPMANLEVAWELAAERAFTKIVRKGVGGGAAGARPRRPRRGGRARTWS